MGLVFRGLMAGLAMAAMAGPLLAAGPEAAAEEVDEVSMEESPPKGEASPVPSPTFSATPAPSVEPTVAPTPAAQEAAKPAPEPTKQPLSDPGFDKASQPSDDSDGLVIIAPGASSPEDSFEAFGIESPFNWRDKKRKAFSAPSGAQEGEDPSLSDEPIELNAPETSDFRERVDVETAAGTKVLGSEKYDTVERAGAVFSGDETRIDGRIKVEKNQRLAFSAGKLFYFDAEPGRQVYPGSIYSVWREGGKVTYGSEKKELGQLFRAVGIARVIRVESESIQARLEKQYEEVRPGDVLRLRDSDRARHFSSLRKGPSEASPSEIQGEIAAVQPPRRFAQAGRIVFLNLGRSQGIVPGMRLAVYRDRPEAAEPTKVLPGPMGRIGELEVLSVHRSSATARVSKSVAPLAPGDRVRFR